MQRSQRNQSFVHEERTREVVHPQSAAFGEGHRLYVAADRAALDSEVVDMSRDAAQVHVGIVHTELGIAMHEPFHAEIDIHGVERAYQHLEPTVALLADAVYNLLDVHRTPFGLAQDELAVLHTTHIQYQTVGDAAEAADISRNAAGIDERVAVEVLDIESADAHLVEQTDGDMVDAYAGADFLRREIGGEIGGAVLHRRNGEQQREQNGQNYQQ